jgi:hypothetical protein
MGAVFDRLYWARSCYEGFVSFEPTSAQRVTAMGVKAHMDKYFTLISGCLILTASPVTYSVSLPSVVLLLRVWGLICNLDSQPACGLQLITGTFIYEFC